MDNTTDARNRSFAANMRLFSQYREQGRSAENYGVNYAFIEQAALVDLLIEKGLFTRDEYDAKVAEHLENAAPPDLASAAGR